MKLVRGRLGIAVCCGGHLGARSCKILAAHATFVPRYGEKRAGETEIGEIWNMFLHYCESLFFCGTAKVAQ